MPSEGLRQRLEAIRPTCPHGRAVNSLMTQVEKCAGSVKACECCDNATCKPSERTTPWLCPTCKPIHHTESDTP